MKPTFDDFDDVELVRMLRRRLAEQAALLQRFRSWLDDEERRIRDEVENGHDAEVRAAGPSDSVAAVRAADVESYEVDQETLERWEWEDEEHLRQELLRSGPVRCLTAGALLATWGVYETVVNVIAQRVRRVRELDLSPDSLKGSLIGRLRQYFDEVLRFELHPHLETDWPRLEELYRLHNVMAHNGSCVDQRAATDIEKYWKDKTNRPELLILDSVMTMSLLDALRSEDFDAVGWSHRSKSYVVALDHEFVTDTSEFLGQLANELLDRFERHVGTSGSGGSAARG